MNKKNMLKGDIYILRASSYIGLKFYLEGESVRLYRWKMSILMSIKMAT